ncbi:TolC family protein [Marinilabiliaceae bacterium ANBcel2]|nr:TolC family protein [Marinilabiliaceae bacterium ANBcel2]
MKVLLIILFLPFVSLNAEEVNRISFEEFMQQVLSNNLEYIQEQYNVSSSAAAVTAAKVFEEPELEILFPPFDSDEFDRVPRSVEFELEIPIELFGKRRNRIRKAEFENYTAEAQLEDFLRYLRAEAATVFVEISTKQRKAERKALSLEQLNQLLETNEHLYESGEIGETDLVQTRLEVRNFTASLYDAKAELSSVHEKAYRLMGGIPEDSLVVDNDAQWMIDVPDYLSLRENAISNRTDIQVAERELQTSQAAVNLARSERLPDISLIAGYHNETGRGAHSGLAAFYGGLVIPLNFSGLNRGEYQQALYSHKQSEVNLNSVLLEVESGVKRAWDNYSLYSQKLTLYDEEILKDAERVRDAVVFSYQRGEVSLLRVLEAQRSLNESYLNYYETLAEYVDSIIELSFESGEWLLQL